MSGYLRGIMEWAGSTIAKNTRGRDLDVRWTERDIWEAANIQFYFYFCFAITEFCGVIFLISVSVSFGLGGKML